MALKRLCRRIEFENPDQYKLHTFRHAFASMLARNTVAYKYALEFMGHQDSEILSLYYRQFDDVAHQAIGTIAYKVQLAGPANA
jgi:integrase